MYLTISERLGRILLPIGFFAVPPEIRAFLDKVGKNPKSFEPLLLTTLFHPDPRNSPYSMETFVMIHAPPGALRDLTAIVTRKLKEIFNQHQKDPQFNRQVIHEKKLRNQLVRTTRELAPKTLEPFLHEAWMSGDSPDDVGKMFAAKVLPPALRPGRIKSRIPEAHFFSLGQLLDKLAEEKRKADGAFKVRAEMALRDRMLTLLSGYMVHRPNELKPFLLEAALSSEASLLQVGRSFAQNLISSKLVKLASESHFSADHFKTLGKQLKAYANGLRRRDRAFDRLVTEEEVKRRQSKQK